ncbi:hypothetical protein L6252_03960 [Candidatus Parcubacteria bacterium]|nr:hypothetical protein [Candidatus Parcubacteria bacterium]
MQTDVHHWDKNYKNNTPDNLVLFCPNHHREAHLGIITKENYKKTADQFRGMDQ